ncbi:MAG: MBL fold metallo-hydrolase [Atribacterota bacterium]|jgi:glyoxylase-like metal-dependent hydrolase (beta-lactamase superfamily II)|nr:MBL fold metallo-hydrolase [Atribacterota bacterium]MDD4897056.1 MBL fold metallo-hydrolase [Atribacterota bacterium]MDD5637016.1 MBL fold metallo-hydrolase [Atribacterota bacterium]
MELRQVTENTYYIPGPTNLGLFVEDKKAILIDSGNDESAGRKIFRLLEEKGWQLSKIINTHSNADHIGGNAYLQKKTGCDILATAVESIFISEPWLEPFLLWGAFPFKAMRNKFLQAQPSEVTHIINTEGMIKDTPLQAFPLKGHFIQMIGIKTPDDVLFIADSLFSLEIINKYGLTVKSNIEQALNTFSWLEKLSAKLFIPAHAQPTGDIGDLIRVNRDQVEQINKKIITYCYQPVSRERILQLLVNDYHLQLSSVQFVLTHITVAAHLSYLNDKHMIKPIFDDGKMLWVNIGVETGTVKKD